MPSSNLRRPSAWPAAWTRALDYLAAFPHEHYVLATAGTRPALATEMRKAQAMRESIYAYNGWPTPVAQLARGYRIRFDRRLTAGLWCLYIRAEPLRHDLGKMFLLALQEPGKTIDNRDESPDDPDSLAPNTVDRQAP